MKAALYIRCSTSEQEVANQRLALEQWAERKGFSIVHIYQESESAWRNGHQRELSRLLSDAHKHKFDIVACWSLDRLSRQGPLTILSIVNRLKHNGIGVISYQEPWTEAPGELADLLYSIIAWVANFESRRLSERTKAGLERTKRQGTVLGRPPGARDKKRRKKRSPKVTFEY